MTLSKELMSFIRNQVKKRELNMRMSKQEQRFTKLFMASMVVFLLLIAAQTLALELLDMPIWLQVVVTLVPMLPLIWSFKIFLNSYRKLDEYLKALTGEAFLWMLGILCFASFAYGMLKMKFAIPDFNLAFILPIVFGGHGLILQILLWRDNEK